MRRHDEDRRRAIPGSIDDEVAHHLEMRTRELVEQGWDPEEARVEARRRFGDVDDIKRAAAREDALAVRRRRLSQWLEETITDLSVGLRRLLRSPGFSAVAVLTLALGIGANSALFSVLQAVVLQPLPFGEPDRLVQVWESAPSRGWDYFAMSELNYLDYRDANRSLDGMAAVTIASANLTGSGEPERLDVYRVSHDLLATLGLPPLHGRELAAAEDGPDAEAAVVVLGHDLWQRRFDGDPDIVGDELVLDDVAHRVVGVAPRLTPLLTDDALLMPLAAGSNRNRGDHRLMVVGRLATDTTPSQAEKDLDSIAARLAERYPESNEGFDTRVRPLYDALVPEETRSSLYVLLGAVGLVLLIACANLSNLMLARATRRQRELAIYGALGASRGRVVRQLVTESLLVSLVGGTVGIAVAHRVTTALPGLEAATRVPRLDQVTVDGTVLAFTLGISVLAGLVGGVLPALQATGGRLAGLLSEGGRGSTGTRRALRIRRALMVAEVALSVILLAGAGLLLRSFWLVQSVDPGIDVERILTMEISVPITSDADMGAAATRYRTLLEEIRGVPGVEDAGAISGLPFGGGATVMDFVREGRELDPQGGVPSAYWRLTTRGYFDTAGIELLQGRLFDNDGGDGGGPHRAVISRRMAERHWPDDDPIGQRFLGWRDPDRVITVVGVVQNVRERSLETAADNMVYLPYYDTPFWPEMFLVVRAQGDPAAVAPDVRAAIGRVDPSLPVSFVRPLSDVVAESLGPRRLNTVLLGAFATIALLLAAAGIYGVISYGVAERTGEVGVRMALGARAVEVVGLMVRQGMLAVGVGVAVGLVGAFAVTRVLASQLFGVAPVDPASFVAATAFLVLVALVACSAPALRAARVDPMETLRET